MENMRARATHSNFERDAPPSVECENARVGGACRCAVVAIIVFGWRARRHAVLVVYLCMRLGASVRRYGATHRWQ